MLRSLLSMLSHSDQCRHILCTSHIKVQLLEVVRATEALLKKLPKKGRSKPTRVIWTAGSTVKVAPYTADRDLDMGVCHNADTKQHEAQ